MARVAVLSDTHFHHERKTAVGNRRAGMADILLLRAVHRLNRYVRPDLTLLLGDIINDPDSLQAETQFQSIRSILDRLTMPWLALPGNHDGTPERFFRHFPRPLDRLDVAGVRFLTFLDPEEPGYKARRREGDLQRMARARADGWRGPVVMLQHVPIFPPGTRDCPYNYVNAADVLTQMEHSGIQAALSGHYHPGFDPLRWRDLDFVVAPALCEAPFPYLILDIDGTSIRSERQVLAMPAALALTDTHIHTHLAYCNENMEIALARDLATDFGLDGMRFTEHSGHLYFDRADYGTRCFAEGIASARPDCCRMTDYLRTLASNRIDPQTWGIEIDADYRGSPVVRPADLCSLPFRVGALHALRAIQEDPAVDDAKAADAFMAVLQRFLPDRYNVLAHPFRVFRRAGRRTPPGIFEPTVRMLRQCGTAAEVNFHTDDPDPAFVRLCIQAGVPLAFGSDAHNLYEIGEFFPHLQLLGRAGYDGDPRDVLLKP